MKSINFFTVYAICLFVVSCAALGSVNARSLAAPLNEGRDDSSEFPFQRRTKRDVPLLSAFGPLKIINTVLNVGKFLNKIIIDSREEKSKMQREAFLQSLQQKLSKNLKRVEDLDTHVTEAESGILTAIQKLAINRDLNIVMDAAENMDSVNIRNGTFRPIYLFQLEQAILNLDHIQTALQNLHRDMISGVNLPQSVDLLTWTLSITKSPLKLKKFFETMVLCQTKAYEFIKTIYVACCQSQNQDKSLDYCLEKELEPMKEITELHAKRLLKQQSAYFNVDPCDSNPCGNGGSCARAGNEYKCSCEPDFMGADCLTRKIKKFHLKLELCKAEGSGTWAFLSVKLATSRSSCLVAKFNKQSLSAGESYTFDLTCSPPINNVESIQLSENGHGPGHAVCIRKVRLEAEDRMCYTDDTGELWLKQANLWSFQNLTSLSFSSIHDASPKKFRGDSRKAKAVVAAVVEDLIFVFGATGEDDSSNDIVRWYDAARGVWERKVANGEVPPNVEGPCAVANGDKIYFFGGLNSNNSRYNDRLYSLEPLTQHWTLEELPSNIEIRGHSHMICFEGAGGKEIMFYGGFRHGNHNKRVFVYEPETKKWRVEETSDDQSVYFSKFSGVVLTNEEAFLFPEDGRQMTKPWRLDLRTFALSIKDFKIPRDSPGYVACSRSSASKALCFHQNSHEMLEFDFSKDSWQKVGDFEKRLHFAVYVEKQKRAVFVWSDSVDKIGSLED